MDWDHRSGSFLANESCMSMYFVRLVWLCTNRFIGVGASDVLPRNACRSPFISILMSFLEDLSFRLSGRVSGFPFILVIEHFYQKSDREQSERYSAPWKF